MRPRWLLVCVGLAAAAAGSALAASSAPTTFEACIAKVKLAAKNSQTGTFYVSPRVSCLRPASLRTTASIGFTTCPTAVKEEACIIGVQSISFTSRGGFPGTGSGTIPYGGDSSEVFVAVRGVGTFHCEWRYVEQVYGTVLERGSWDEPLTDQIVGFVGAANGGFTIGHGVYASHFTSTGRTLRQPTATAREYQHCKIPLPEPGSAVVRLAWPTKTLAGSALRGSSLRVVTTGTKAASLPLPDSLSGLTGAKLKATVRWSSTWVLAPQY